ncbi:MAG: DUF4974 domain-containing protein [Prolixibacteraceae bacterium]|jgi:ferric-dicitrate binding protein FerR (iron transport regulator)|nr:DUF4974 domain-containing protein [Prolixibacteraceae bacterium]
MTDFFNRYINNECNGNDFDAAVRRMVSPEEKGLLEQQMYEHWRKTTGEGKLPDLTTTLHRIHYQISKKENTQKMGRRFLHNFSRVAAILVVPLTIAFGYLLQNNLSEENPLQTISSPLASRTAFDLPDGSKIWLNAGSSISFPLHFTGKQRLVQLNGQAYFDVKKDRKPFLIETDKFTIEVLGTAFDVSAYQGEKASVTLVHGKVSIGTVTGNKTILGPGQQALIDAGNGQISKRDVDPNLFVSWKDDLLLFNDEPLDEVVLKLERWYNLDIVIEDESIRKIHVTGTFRYESINEILQLMEITDSIQYAYNKNERKIILKHK